jgi:hypothetical protein
LIGVAQFMLGRSLLGQHKPLEAEQYLSKALQLMNDNLGETSTWSALCRAALGGASLMQGKLKEAEPVLLDSYAVIQRSERAEDREMAAQVRSWIEDLYRQQKRPDAAREYFAKVEAK